MKHAAKRIEIFREVLRKEEIKLNSMKATLQKSDQDLVTMHVNQALCDQSLGQTQSIHRALIRILDMADKDVKEYEL